MLCPGGGETVEKVRRESDSKDKKRPFRYNLLEGIICQLKVLLIEKLNMIKIIRYISVQEELLLLFFFYKDNN